MGLSELRQETVAGVHDLIRVLDLAEHFGARALICIDKCDLNAEQAELIRSVARERGMRVVGEVPFDSQVNETLMAGEIVVSGSNGPTAHAIRALAAGIDGGLQGLGGQGSGPATTG